MKKTKKEDVLFLDCFRELFAKSTPKGDFDELLANATINERGEKVIPFMDYEIDDGLLHDIIEKYTIQVKPRWKRIGFKNGVLLGPSPKSK